MSTFTVNANNGSDIAANRFLSLSSDGSGGLSAEYTESSGVPHLVSSKLLTDAKPFKAAHWGAPTWTVEVDSADPPGVGDAVKVGSAGKALKYADYNGTSVSGVGYIGYVVELLEDGGGDGVDLVKINRSQPAGPTIDEVAIIAG